MSILFGDNLALLGRRQSLEEGDDVLVGGHSDVSCDITRGIAFPVVEAIAAGRLGSEDEENAIIVAAAGGRDGATASGVDRGG